MNLYIFMALIDLFVSVFMFLYFYSFKKKNFCSFKSWNKYKKLLLNKLILILTKKKNGDLK